MRSWVKINLYSLKLNTREHWLMTKVTHTPWTDDGLWAKLRNNPSIHRDSPALVGRQNPTVSSSLWPLHDAEPFCFCFSFFLWLLCNFTKQNNNNKNQPLCLLYSSSINTNVQFVRCMHEDFYPVFHILLSVSCNFTRLLTFTLCPTTTNKFVQVASQRLKWKGCVYALCK